MPRYLCSVELEIEASNALQAAHMAQDQLHDALNMGERYVWSVHEPQMGRTIEVDTEAE